MEHRRGRAHTACKYKMWESGCKLPSQVVNLDVLLLSVHVRPSLKISLTLREQEFCAGAVVSLLRGIPCQIWKKQFASVPTTSGSPMVNPRIGPTSIGWMLNANFSRHQSKAWSAPPRRRNLKERDTDEKAKLPLPRPCEKMEPKRGAEVRSARSSDFTAPTAGGVSPAADGYIMGHGHCPIDQARAFRSAGATRFGSMAGHLSIFTGTICLRAASTQTR